jgi:hypothetical protein
MAGTFGMKLLVGKMNQRAPRMERVAATTDFICDPRLTFKS